MFVERAEQAYIARAAEYIELFGSIDAAAEFDRDLVLGWALSVDGRIIDVGCGPGQWTAFLADHGVDIEGIDPVPAFVDEAQLRHRGFVFRLGRAERLDVDGASLGGILAWYSLIHMDPDHVDHALNEFARRLRPGGGRPSASSKGRRSKPSTTLSRPPTSGPSASSQSASNEPASS